MRASPICLIFLIPLLFVATPSVVPAGDIAQGSLLPPEENPEFVIYDLPAAEIEKRLGIPFEEMLERRERVLERVLSARQKTAATDTTVALVMLCEWADHLSDPAHPREMYDTLLFSQGVVPTGSTREWFLENSYGDHWIEGDVYGWFQQPTDIDDWFQDFFAAADPFIDYSDYDADNDGYVDALWIFHAGPGQEETHNTADIWSYAVWGLNYMTDDGVIIDRYACNPEEHADEEIISIRVGCHEATHVLGMPDLYDYHDKLDTTTYYTPLDRNDHPVMDWCVMGYYGYNISSYGTRSDPSHMSAWIKQGLGYVTPTVLSSSQQDVSAPEVELNPVVYKVERPGSSGDEYFLIENRNTTSTAIFDHWDGDFSAYFPWFTPGRNQKDSGLIIYHVDDDVGSNTYGPSDPHYRVIVEDAGYDSGNPWDGTSEFSEEWYPYEFRIGAAYAAEDAGQTSFTPNTSPSTRWYGQNSNIWITNISESGQTMTFDIGFGNAWPAIVDQFPSISDTIIVYQDVVLFSAATVDEDGDATTYAWSLNGSPVQSGSDSTYTYTANSAGAYDTLEVVATDGSLSDSFTWSILVDVSTDVADNAPALTKPALSASPNPFNPAVTIRYSIPAAGDTRLTVHDAAGRLVNVLHQGYADAGSHAHTWRGQTASGGETSSGIYFVRLATGDHITSMKVVLLR